MNNLRLLTKKKKRKIKIKIDKWKISWKGANDHLDSGKAKNSIRLKWLRKNSWQRQISILKESQDWTKYTVEEIPGEQQSAI